MHNLKRLLMFSLATYNALFCNQKIQYVNGENSNYGNSFNISFNDLSDSDISYSKGNMTTFRSNNLEYYASSFSFNAVNKELQFGRNTSASKNISEIDEMYMCFDLAGDIESINFLLGTINTNRTGDIVLKV